MAGVGRKIASFIWWSYPRGSLEYDVMVGIILAFIFLTPRHLFHDQPRPPAAPAAAVAVPFVPSAPATRAARLRAPAASGGREAAATP